MRLPIDAAATIIRDGYTDEGPDDPKRVEPCTCGAPRGDHTGDHGTGKCEATGCRRYRANQTWALVYRVLDADRDTLGDAIRAADRRERNKHYRANPRKEGEWSIGASDTGTCPRAIQYRNAPPEGLELAPEDKRAARIGTIVHEETMRRMKALYPWRQFKRKVRIAGLDRDSELDMYDPLTGVVDDTKTAGDWKWDKIGDDGPDWETWEQVLLYGLALEEEGEYVTRCRLSYIKRCNGADETFEIPYNRTQAEAARQRLLGYATALDNGWDLPKAGTGPSHGFPCSGCPFRWDCWNVPAAERVGRSPESYTVLGAEPEDETIVWAIEQRMEASAALGEAKRLYEERKVLLDGIPPGRYGPYEGYEQKNPGAGKVNEHRYVETLEANYVLPDDERPPLDRLIRPTNPLSFHTRWGKVRKATLERERLERQRREQAETESEE
jgi:hypothetical protein